MQPLEQVSDSTWPSTQRSRASFEGLTTALSYMVAPQLRAGTLVTVLDPFTPPPVPVQLVYPQSRLVAAKVRAFMDFAGPRLTRILAAEACFPATG